MLTKENHILNLNNHENKVSILVMIASIDFYDTYDVITKRIYVGNTIIVKGTLQILQEFYVLIRFEAHKCLYICMTYRITRSKR